MTGRLRNTTELGGGGGGWKYLIGRGGVCNTASGLLDRGGAVCCTGWGNIIIQAVESQGIFEKGGIGGQGAKDQTGDCCTGWRNIITGCSVLLGARVGGTTRYLEGLGRERQIQRWRRA